MTNYHAVAVKAVCAEYRHLAKLARQGQTVRPSVTLLRALGWVVEAPASAPATCRSCHAPLVDWKQEDGRCARCVTARRRLLEMELFGEAA